MYINLKNWTASYFNGKNENYSLGSMTTGSHVPKGQEKTAFIEGTRKVEGCSK